MKTIIIYLYKEDDNTKSNLDFFVNQSKQNELCDYYLLINDYKCSVNIPKFFNVIQQENSLDFPSYKRFFENNNIDIFKYKYFYFLNSSCVGPFIPQYCSNPWYYYLNNILNCYDFIGPIAEVPPQSVNFTNNPFIHTYMFGFNKAGMNLFLNLMNKYESFDKDFCIYFERLLSYEIIINGLKMKSLLTLFQNIDLNDPKNWNFLLWSNSEQTCFEIPLNYHGIDVDPYEVIFVKNIRKPHEHRSSDRSGISENLYKKVNNYMQWMT